MTTITLTIVATHCGVCGVHFGLESVYQRRRLDDGNDFWCPNGHKISYEAANQAEKTEKALRAQLEASRSLANREQGRRRLAERQRAAAKGEVTKIKKRVANGVCPCCKRSFVNVARHMGSQHPDYPAAEEAP